MSYYIISYYIIGYYIIGCNKKAYIYHHVYHWTKHEVNNYNRFFMNFEYKQDTNVFVLNITCVT